MCSAVILAAVRAVTVRLCGPLGIMRCRLLSLHVRTWLAALRTLSGGVTGSHWGLSLLRVAPFSRGSMRTSSCRTTARRGGIILFVDVAVSPPRRRLRRWRPLHLLEIEVV